MEESTKQMLFGLFFFILGFSLFIMSILDIRSYQDNDNQIIKDNIDTINSCTYIIMVLAAIMVLTGIMFMIRSKRQDFLDIFFSLSARTGSFIMIAVGILILIIGIVQRVKINNILPDMSDENAIKSYNDHHTLPASSVLGSNLGIIVSGTIFLFAGIVQFFMNRESADKLNKTKAEIQHEKNMKIVESKRKEWEDAVKAGTYSEDKLEELELIYESARSTSEKAWSDYKKGIQKAFAENTQPIAVPTNVKASLFTPVSAAPSAQGGVKPSGFGSSLNW